MTVSATAAVPGVAGGVSVSSISPPTNAALPKKKKNINKALKNIFSPGVNSTSSKSSNIGNGTVTPKGNYGNSDEVDGLADSMEEEHHIPEGEPIDFVHRVSSDNTPPPYVENSNSQVAPTQHRDTTVNSNNGSEESSGNTTRRRVKQHRSHSKDSSEELSDDSLARPKNNKNARLYNKRRRRLIVTIHEARNLVSRSSSAESEKVLPCIQPFVVVKVGRWHKTGKLIQKEHNDLNPTFEQVTFQFEEFLIVPSSLITLCAFLMTVFCMITSIVSHRLSALHWMLLGRKQHH